MSREDRLLKDIEELRDQMMKITLQKGFTDDETILISQKLDQLIHSYQREKLKRN